MIFVVIGNKSHGKDSLSLFITKAFGLGYASTSHFALEHFLFAKMISSGEFSYENVKDAYDDRDSYREYLYQEIQSYNYNDQAKLGRMLLEIYPVLCGIRHGKELNALKQELGINAIFWVDTSQRKPLETSNSISVSKDDATHHIDNNGSLEMACKQIWDIMIEQFSLNPISSFDVAYQSID